jgi:hypothetical protein
MPEVLAQDLARFPYHLLTYCAHTRISVQLASIKHSKICSKKRTYRGNYGVHMKAISEVEVVAKTLGGGVDDDA